MADHAHLRRLQRLEKLRGIAGHNALAEAGRAETRLAGLEMLQARTNALITGYASRTDAQCGADLARQRIYLGELQGMVGRNDSDVARARDQADARAAEAAAAERSRAAVETRADAIAQAIARARSAAALPLGARNTRKP
ncbi:hypothetical protein [Novosphingobium sp.]|uniref:hypothetical protein n=1 Tax=Novosphingobium sp. TaxID=1874826 RepID=UPI003D0A96DC